MTELYELEELADMAVNDIREFINTEQNFVEREHELGSKLQSIDYIIGHLDERIPQNMIHLHDINKKITENVLEVRELIESSKLKDLRIEKEEIELVQKIKEDIQHKDWKAVKSDIDLETHKENKVLRLEINELKELHSKFKGLAGLMSKSNLISALNKDLRIQKQKEDYEKLEEYYFLHIYKFAVFYENLLKNLWKKEKTLFKNLKKHSNGLS